MATAANEARWRAGAASVLSEAVGAADARSASSGSGVEGVAGGCVGNRNADGLVVEGLFGRRRDVEGLFGRLRRRSEA